MTMLTSEKRILLAVVLGLSTLLCSCRSEYDADVEPRPNGEAGPDLSRVYSFTFIEVSPCFRDVMRAEVTKLRKPCLAMWAVTGAPTKAHMTFTVDEKALYTADAREYLKFTIAVFVFQGYKHFEGLGSDFQEVVEPVLRNLEAGLDGGSARRVDMPDSP
jgi:hypothetical protein